MDLYSVEVSNALDIYADDATPTDMSRQKTVWVDADSQIIQEVADDLLERVDLEDKIWGITRDTAKYGESIKFLPQVKLPSAQRGGALEEGGIRAIEDVDHLRVEPVLEDGVIVSYLVDANTREEFNPWDFLHCRLTTRNSLRGLDPYIGAHSMLEATRPLWMILHHLEQSLAVNRLSRGPVKNVFYIDVTGLSVKEAIEAVNEYRMQYTRYRYPNPDAGTFDLTINPFTEAENVYWPVREGMTHRVDTIGGGVDVRSIEDIKYYRDKMLLSLKIPREFLAFEGGGGLLNTSLCLRGNTKIKLLNGTSVAIQDLAEKGEGCWLYAFDLEKKEFVPAWAHSPRKTRRNAKMVRVHLDTGEHIDCTPDHPILMRSGKYVNAEDLQPGDSLRALGFKSTNNGYELIWQPGKRSWKSTYREVANSFYGEDNLEPGWHVHHVDVNKENNEPPNLRPLTKSEHYRIHQELIINSCDRTPGHPWYDTLFDDEHQERRSARMKKQAAGEYGNPLFGEAHSRGLSKEIKRRLQEPAYAEMWRQACEAGTASLVRHCAEDPEWAHGTRVHALWTRVQTILEHTEKNLEEFESSEWDKICFDAGYHGYGSISLLAALRARREFGEEPEDVKELVDEKISSLERVGYSKDNITMKRGWTFVQNVLGHLELGPEDLDFVSSEDWDQARIDLYPKSKGRPCPRLIRAIQIRDDTVGAPFNHKVVSVEWLEETEDTYDITVEKYHNFVLDCGVVVHNSFKDQRFSRSVRKLQRSVIQAVTRLIKIELALNGIDPQKEENEFSVNMGIISMTEELQKVDILKSAADMAANLVAIKQALGEENSREWDQTIARMLHGYMIRSLGMSNDELPTPKAALPEGTPDEVRDQIPDNKDPHQLDLALKSMGNGKGAPPHGDTSSRLVTRGGMMEDLKALASGSSEEERSFVSDLTSYFGLDSSKVHSLRSLGPTTDRSRLPKVSKQEDLVVQRAFEAEKSQQFLAKYTRWRRDIDRQRSRELEEELQSYIDRADEEELDPDE